MSMEKCKQIHDATMRILEKTGMHILHPDARAIFKAHGARVEGEIVYLTEELVMEWIGKAPAEVPVMGFDPRADAVIRHGDTLNAPAAGPTSIMDKDGNIRPVQLDDYVKMIKLYETCPSYSINGGVPCQPQGIPTQWSSLLLHFVSLQLSRKPLWAGTGNYQQMEAVMDLVRVRHGLTVDEFIGKPYLIEIINTNTPLALDLNMTETLLTAAKYRQPLIAASAAMAGLTAPVTVAATITLTNAEVIAALVLAQMAAPGTPVIYGSQSAGSDLRTGSISIGSPEAALCYKYAGEMSSFYGIPCRAGGALTDAKKLDSQAGYESMMTYNACRDGDVSVVFQSAGILDSYMSASFEKMIVDFEIIDYATRYHREFEIDEESVPEDVIDEVGHGGQYLVEDHTIEFCRIDPLTPNISVRGPHDNGVELLELNIAKRMEELLDEYEYPELDTNTHSSMKHLLDKHGIETDLINLLDVR